VLNRWNVTSWGDSLLGHVALKGNLERNGFSEDQVDIIPGNENPEGLFDLVLLKIPKSMAHWEDTLLRLRKNLKPGTRILAGSMIKHTPAKAYKLLEACIGPVKTSLGWKKARIAEAQFESAKELPSGIQESEYSLPGCEVTLRNRANVFSRKQLDDGSFLLLRRLPRTEAAIKVVDIGCGSGALSLGVAAFFPAAEIFGTDESYQAVASARDNLARTPWAADRNIRFEVAVDLAVVASGSVDLVVCNPPFHQHQAVAVEMAEEMIGWAQRVLKPGGEFWLVGNRHLGHQARLTTLFGNCAVEDNDDRFVVLSCVKPI
jgi:23S rRNA (guanine1835-N2)-methyltransferase